MARQLKDGSTPGQKDKRVYDDVFGDVSPVSEGPWDWEQCDCQLMARAFTLVNKRGDLMSLCTNSQNTAGKATIITGGERKWRWFATYDEADAFFEKVAHA